MDWTNQMKSAVADLYMLPDVSFTDMASIINEKFKTTVSRAAVLGAAKRMGLKGKLPKNSAPINPRNQYGDPGPVSQRRRRRYSLVQPAAEPAIIQCAEVEPRHISLAELENGDCRYPFGDGPFTFCGAPKIDGSSYCRSHHKLCWVKAAPAKDRYLARRVAA